MKAARGSSWGALLLLVALGPGCQEDAPPPSVVDLVQDVKMLATSSTLSEVAAQETASALMEGRLDLDAWLDETLADPRLGEEVARAILLGANQDTSSARPVPSDLALDHFEGPEGETIYGLRGPCSKDQAVQVSPWWAPKSKVWICEDSYRPEVLGDGYGRTCGASTLKLRRGSDCGCGPRLIFCTRGEEHHDAVQQSAQEEVNATVALVINQDLPLEQLFLMNETVRDRNAEYLYVRARVAAGEDDALVEMKGFGERPRLAPRHSQVEGQHAGLLTTPSMIYGSDALRGTMRNFYDNLWCISTSSSRVTTQDVLGLDVVDLREGDGWRDLASMDICTDCHARLDYGMQFFSGYPSSSQGLDFRPTQAQRGEGPLYATGIDDLRGTAPLNPLGFARLALSQDEFASCMVHKVAGYVLGADATPDDLDAVRLRYEQTHSFRAMMHTALRRLVVSSLAPVFAPSDAPPAPASPGGGEGHPSERTLARLEESCFYCHDGADAPDLAGAGLSRDTMLWMLEQVSFGKMPPNPEMLAPGERQALAEDLIDDIWAEDESRAIATDYFIGGLRGFPVQDYAPALDLVARRAGMAESKGWRSAETRVSRRLQTYTPGFAASTGLAALEACKQRALTGDALEHCVEEASRPDALVVGLVGAPGER